MADAAWPRTCPRCANVSYRNPLPVTIVLIPVVEATGTGVLAIRRAVAPRALQAARAPVVSRLLLGERRV